MIFRVILFLALFGCAEPYQPKTVTQDVHYLVVDGFVDAGGDSVSVSLSRTLPISSTSTPPQELNAVVYLEDTNGKIIPVPERGNGRYAETNLGIDIADKYRLSITTQGKKYLSDFVQFYTSPPIDSVTWKTDASGAQINVSTHNPSSGSRYYLYTFTETWQYSSYFDSQLQLVNDSVTIRPFAQQIHTCWNIVPSYAISIASTAQLSKDILTDFSITHIEYGSQRLFLLYSILVNQACISEDAYNYWQSLQKTTEDLNSIFATQPSRVIGNIHNIDDLEDPVFGYFSGSSITQKRIFIKWDQLPPYPQIPPDCETVLSSYPNMLLSVGSGAYQILDIKGSGYVLAYKDCSDCRVQGGVTIKPNYWP